MKSKVLLSIVITVLIAALVVPISIYATTADKDSAVKENGTSHRAELAEVTELELISKKQVIVTYDKSRVVSEGFADVFKDEKGNDYIVKNGKVTGFYSNEIDHPATDCTPIGKNTALKLAISYLSEYTENSEDYVISEFTEKENYGQYYVTLSRQVGNVFTEEYAKVSIMYDGALKSVAVYNDGKYADVPADVVANITEETLIAFANSEMDIIYPDKDGEFELKSYRLVKDSSGYYINISGNFADRAETVRYELDD